MSAGSVAAAGRGRPAAAARRAAGSNTPNRKPRQPSQSLSFPTTSSEGRDPFFPNSTRVYAGNPENQIRGPVLTELALKSILGTPPHVFAIINNHTFAAGDDGDVITKSGAAAAHYLRRHQPAGRHRDRRSRRHERSIALIRRTMNQPMTTSFLKTSGPAFHMGGMVQQVPCHSGIILFIHRPQQEPTGVQP